MKNKPLVQFCWLACLLLILSACTSPTPPPTAEIPQATQTPSPTPAPSATATALWQTGDTWDRPADGMRMLYVPAGEFQMGSESGEADEMPVHTVFLEAYWIDQTEVTAAMYALFAPETAPQGAGDLPVVHVSWEAAVAYCTWAGAVLPTEAQWEKAARGSTGRTYPWGDQAPAGDLANFADAASTLSWADVNIDDGYKVLAPVGTYPAGQSPYGALDLAGNAAEWVNDWYGELYYSQSDSSRSDGPFSGEFRVIRGGSWYSTANGLRASDRSWYIPEGGSQYTGFRCVSPSPGDSGAP
jgi:eukaryotic-like serine/threonine-protein kinase